MKKKEIIFKYIALISLLFMVLLNSNVNIVKARDVDAIHTSIWDYTVSEISELETKGEIKKVINLLNKIPYPSAQYFIDLANNTNKEGDERRQYIFSKKKELYELLKALEGPINNLSEDKDVKEWKKKYVNMSNSPNPTNLKEELANDIRTQKQNDSAVNKDDSSKGETKVYPKFKMPNVSSDDREKGNLDDIISDANSFVDKKQMIR